MKAENFRPIRGIFSLFLILVLCTLLRIPELQKFPPSLYSDEVNQAYNAFSILKTGRDEHNVYIPASLRSFGDWKPPLQTYLIVPSIFLFGLNEYAVRLPNALLGITTVLLSYLLSKQLFLMNKRSEKIALLSALFMAISPWHHYQSRSAMLVMVFLSTFMLAAYFLLKIRSNSKYLYLSAIFFALSLYSYYAAVVIVPVYTVVIFLKYRKKIILFKKQLIISLIIGLLITFPLFFSFIKNNNVFIGRAKYVSVFFDQGINLKVTQFKKEDLAENTKHLNSSLYHNKPYLYATDILKRFLTHFQGDFLILQGDYTPPFKIPNMGVIYFADYIFFILGLYFLIKKREQSLIFIVAWLIVAMVPASFTFLTPSHNRTFIAVFPIILLCSYGITNFNCKITNKRAIFIFTLMIIYIPLFYGYLNNYYKVLPNKNANEWLYGYKELVGFINDNSNRFSKIYFLPGTGMSYTYILFYNQYSPKLVQGMVKRDYLPDRFGFEHVTSFDKYVFLNKERSWEELDHLIGVNELFIGRDPEIPFEKTKHTINYPDGTIAFKLTYL